MQMSLGMASFDFRIGDNNDDDKTRWFYHITKILIFKSTDSCTVYIQV